MTNIRYGIFQSAGNEWAGSSLKMLKPAYEFDALDRITVGRQAKQIRKKLKFLTRLALVILPWLSLPKKCDSLLH
jgi:hypothetical protein